MVNMEMDDLLGEMAADWQLDQAFGLTLFDDPWKSLGQSEPMKVGPQAPTVVKNVLEEDRTEDPFSQQWMEETGLAELFDSIAAEPEKTDSTTTSNDADSNYSKDDAIRLLAEILEGKSTSCELLPAPEPVTPPEGDVVPVISFNTTEEVAPISEILLRDDYGVLGSPLSVEDVESLLSGSEGSCSEASSPASSRPPSPSPSPPPKKPISDLEKLLTSNTPLSQYRVKNTAGRSGRPKVKTVSDCCDIQLEFLSKKDKKKIQNKNAAIRYRMKKKLESDAVRSEEKLLEDKNRTLSDKVDQLQREIQYIKDLMSEVYNAKRVKKT